MGKSNFLKTILLLIIIYLILKVLRIFSIAIGGIILVLTLVLIVWLIKKFIFK